MSDPNQTQFGTSGRSKPFGWPGFEVSLRCQENDQREALEQVMNGLAPLNLDVEEQMTVELVLAEALNNIIEHAYDDRRINGPIKIECRHRPDGLHVKIKDKGQAMPDGMIPVGNCPDIDVDLNDLPEGGFGWFLIKDLAKDVEYRRVGDENRLKLRIAVAYSQTSH